MQVRDMRLGSKLTFSVTLVNNKSGAHTLSFERPSSLENPPSSLLASFLHYKWGFFQHTRSTCPIPVAGAYESKATFPAFKELKVQGEKVEQG